MLMCGLFLVGRLVPEGRKSPTLSHSSFFVANTSQQGSQCGQRVETLAKGHRDVPVSHKNYLVPYLFYIMYQNEKAKTARSARVAGGGRISEGEEPRGGLGYRVTCRVWLGHHAG